MAQPDGPDPYLTLHTPHSALRTVFSSLLNLFFPGRCRLCGELLEEISRMPVCRACWQSVEPLAAAGRCAVCGLPGLSPSITELCGECTRESPAFDRARSYGAYHGALRKLVHLFKYREMTPLARPLGAWLAEVARREEGFAGCQAVVAMPLDPARRRLRGYNQAELLAREAARRLELPLLGDACRRIRPTAPQAGLTRAERLENVRGAFKATERAVADRIILLVDDVMTTGATLNACARALRQAGARQVLALTVARTIEPLDLVTEDRNGV